MKLKILFRSTALLLVSALFFTACYKSKDSVYIDQLDMTLSYYDTEYDFQQSGTRFAIRDSVGIVTNYLEDEDLDDFYNPGGTSEKIKEYVANKYEALGYTRVATDQEFDVGVNLVVILLESTTVVGYPGYWWGYGGYYGWYGWYYPPYYGWYPWYYTTYTTESGTLLMEYVTGESLREYRDFISDKTDDELEDIPAGDFPPIEFVWQSLVSGVAGQSADYNQNRAQRGVDEAFEQSPYLKIN